MRRFVLALGGIVIAAGCGGQPDRSNLSVLSEADPQRHQEAVRQQAELEQKNREAEARVFASRGAPNPEADSAADAAPSSPSP
ncbi:MAG: hypothetical protein KatS3mg108_0376 [Isosphaeraceae bacterium]|jgi:hypothetical protein|nr:MAG: hypothetical protein KatS3mg108_0376 [Isosphaeraceae bacterium]